MRGGVAWVEVQRQAYLVLVDGSSFQQFMQRGWHVDVVEHLGGRDVLG